VFAATLDSVTFFEPTEELQLDPGSQDGEPELVPINVNHFVDLNGALRFVGEVENRSRGSAEEVETVVRLLDADGSLVAVEGWSIPMNLVPSGDRSPFAVVFVDPPPEWEDYEVLASGSPAGFMLTYTYSDLEFVTHAGLVMEGGEFGVSGTIKNVGDAPAEFVQITATVYGETGQVVGVDYTFAEADVLAPGEESAFGLSIWNLGGEGSTYRLLAQAAEAD
jgi:hypothetical protein